MAKIPSIGAGKAFTLFGFIKKYWYWLILFVIILPTIIHTVKVAIQENNPTYPFFVLSERIFTADITLNEDVNTLRKNPEELIGMAKPDKGIWKTAVYYWKFFFNVIYKIIGNIWLIFFPLVVIFKLIRYRNISEPAKNLFKATIYFFIYLFITHTIMFMQKVLRGVIKVELPMGSDTWNDYLILVLHFLPFHGVYNLITYLINLMVVV